MNDLSVPSEDKIPVGIDEWECALVRYFLAVGSDGDASDIHSLEVTPRTLALACGVDPTRREEVENAFRAALLRDQVHLLRALREGPQRPATSEVPNCFAPLAMTLLIDILLESTEYGGNQFRAKLADWLDIDRTFNDLSGVKLMWEQVARWLCIRVEQGAPFRRLVLPEHPESWRHIGYTRRLSFPSRSDVKVVAQVLATVEERDQDNPVAVIHALSQLVSKKNISIGLKEAYEDFVQSYYSRRRAIADHRFWRLVTRARTAPAAGREGQAVLEIALTVDEEREFRVARENVEGTATFLKLAAALRSDLLLLSVNLGPTIRRGLLFFRQVGLGRWIAEANLAKCRDRVLVAYHDRFDRTIGRRLGNVDRNGQWSLTVDPIGAGKVAAELRICGVITDAETYVFRPTASDGVRVHGAWLGLPGFLPSIDVDTDKVRVVSEGEHPGELRAVAAGRVNLISDAPVAGTFFVEPRLLGRESNSPWRLRLQFVDRAVPHIDLGGARRNRPLLRDWNATRPESVECDLPPGASWSRAHDAVEWLLEALYANGARGWDESDLVELVRRADPDTASAPWRTLRMLQEGCVLEPRLRQGWKGRVWTLAPPRIVPARSAGAPVALVEGAHCAQMLEEFAMAATGMGGTPFRLPGPMRWSVPVTGAVDVEPEALARVLCWEVVPQPAAPSGAPLALAETERRAENYVAAFTWCWRTRRFLAAGAIEGGTRLIQLSHPAGTDHDVYRIECGGRRRHFLSRQAAIVAAHAVARVPLLAFSFNRIDVTARDGGLPDAIAAALRRRRLASGGFTNDCYGYSVTAEDVRWLAALLPGCIAGVPEDAVLAAGEVLSRARHSGGAVRPQWRGGRLVLGDGGNMTKGRNGK